jgi:hypothetical protein
MPRRSRIHRRGLEWTPDLVNSLQDAEECVQRPGYREWLAQAYRMHRRRILASDNFAEAVIVFEADAELVARARETKERMEREFEDTYGHLRDTDDA